jgi:hypothetical protein
VVRVSAARRNNRIVRKCVFYVVLSEAISSDRPSSVQSVTLPCGGGVEYLHRDPASRSRRRKGKSQIWDSKIRSRIPRDSDPRKTALARANSIYKRQTRLLVREGAPQKQDRNCQIVIYTYIWSWGPDGARHQDLLTYWPSVSQWSIVSWLVSELDNRWNSVVVRSW